jgi:hypothetical protein
VLRLVELEMSERDLVDCHPVFLISFVIILLVPGYFLDRLLGRKQFLRARRVQILVLFPLRVDHHRVVFLRERPLQVLHHARLYPVQLQHLLLLQLHFWLSELRNCLLDGLLIL